MAAHARLGGAVSAVRLIAGAALVYAAWDYFSNKGEVQAIDVDYGALPEGQGGVVETVKQGATAALDILEASMAVFRLSAMRNLSPALLDNSNVRAFLRVIRTGEGTADEKGYTRIFGGKQFNSFTDHPRVYVPFGKTSSSAAGAYQFLASTWDETRRIMGLPDFSPASQDMGALGRIAARGALDDVLAGRFESAVRKCALEWASLPSSPYGQPVISWPRAHAIFADAGGRAVA